MALTQRGGADIDQLRIAILSGGANSEQLATAVSGAKTAGNTASWDANGNLTDSGISAAVGGGAFSVNASPFVSVNGVGVSWDDAIFINGTNDQVQVNGA